MEIPPEPAPPTCDKPRGLDTEWCMFPTETVAAPDTSSLVSNWTDCPVESQQVIAARDLPRDRIYVCKVRRLHGPHGRRVALVDVRYRVDPDCQLECDLEWANVTVEDGVIEEATLMAWAADLTRRPEDPHGELHAWYSRHGHWQRQCDELPRWYGAGPDGKLRTGPIGPLRCRVAAWYEGDSREVYGDQALRGAVYEVEGTARPGEVLWAPVRRATFETQFRGRPLLPKDGGFPGEPLATTDLSELQPTTCAAPDPTWPGDEYLRTVGQAIRASCGLPARAAHTVTILWEVLPDGTAVHPWTVSDHHAHTEWGACAERAVTTVAAPTHDCVLIPVVGSPELLGREEGFEYHRASSGNGVWPSWAGPQPPPLPPVQAVGEAWPPDGQTPAPRDGCGMRFKPGTPDDLTAQSLTIEPPAPGEVKRTRSELKFVPEAPLAWDTRYTCHVEGFDSWTFKTPRAPIAGPLHQVSGEPEQRLVDVMPESIRDSGSGPPASGCVTVVVKRLMVQFTDDATVGAVNQLLARHDATIVSMRAGIFLVDVPGPDREHTEEVMHAMHMHPAVKFAVSDLSSPD